MQRILVREVVRHLLCKLHRFDDALVHVVVRQVKIEVERRGAKRTNQIEKGQYRLHF